MLQRNRSTGAYLFYPRYLHVSGGPGDLEWVEASGEGVIYSCTTVRRRAEPGGDFVIVLVDLAEGPRMLSRVVGENVDDVRIGMRVQTEVVAHSWSSREPDTPTVVFRMMAPEEVAA